MDAMADYQRALARAPYGDDAEVERQTEIVLAAGHRIFQTHRFHASDAAHAARLLAVLDPPAGARVLDAGCGVGTLAALMHEDRPGLVVTLLNISAAQLARCPAGFDRIEADFQDVPRADGSFDAIMFCYSLGHGLLDRSLHEAARLLRPGGILFIYDLTADDSTVLIDELGYKAHSVDGVLSTALIAGFVLDRSEPATGARSDAFIEFAGPHAFASIFAGVVPWLFRFVRC